MPKLHMGPDPHATCRELTVSHFRAAVPGVSDQGSNLRICQWRSRYQPRYSTVCKMKSSWIDLESPSYHRPASWQVGRGAGKVHLSFEHIALCSRSVQFAAVSGCDCWLRAAVEHICAD
eukprot:4767892-Amphidinium_carterae.1